MKNNFLYYNSKAVKFRPNLPHKRPGQSFYKDMSNTIKTAIDYPPKLALGKINYIFF